jgi:type I restriction-modification system DNA methylase subunit
MSRLANKMKAGYFPTPEKVANLITGHLSPPKSGDFRWLDPCTGAPRSACL